MILQVKIRKPNKLVELIGNFRIHKFQKETILLRTAHPGEHTYFYRWLPAEQSALFFTQQTGGSTTDLYESI